MKHQGFNFSSLRNLFSVLSLPTGITALLIASSGFMLVPNAVKAGAAPTLTAQVPTTAPVIYVNPATGADTTGAGATAATPYKTISFALNQAQPGTVIQLAPGNYSSESGEQFPLILKPGITLRGDESARGEGILITGGGFYTSRTFARQDVTILANNDTTIAGITATNPNQRGTAVWVESSNPTIINNTFTNIVRDGVFVTGTGNPIIEVNIFIKNKCN